MAVTCAGAPAIAAATTWETGDVFAGVGNGAGSPNGSYNVYSNAGVFKETVSSTTPSSEATGCAFDADANLFGTHFGATKFVKWSATDPHNVLQTFDPAADHPGSSHTESIVFAANGDFYVGHADGDHDVLKYNSSGVFQRAFDVATSPRGTDWIELAADQKTLFYAGEGSQIRRYDLSTDTQLPDFATNGNEYFALRLLPPGDGSGGLLVANGQAYTVPAVGLFFALNLDPKTFSVRVNARRLKAGRHRIRVVSVDKAGNRRSASKLFARCA